MSKRKTRVVRVPKKWELGALGRITYLWLSGEYNICDICGYRVFGGYKSFWTNVKIFELYCGARISGDVNQFFLITHTGLPNAVPYITVFS